MLQLIFSECICIESMVNVLRSLELAKYLLLYWENWSPLQTLAIFYFESAASAVSNLKLLLYNLSQSESNGKP